MILRGGRWEAVVLPEAGARIHALRFDGRDILRTPPDVSAHAREPVFWGSFVLAPWCNRLHRRDAPVLGRRLALPATFEDGTAIHGQVHSVAWEQVGVGEFRVRGGGDGWPWSYEVRQSFSLGEDCELTVALVNLDDSPMPAGLGIHPWFPGRPGVRLPARTVMRDNTAQTASFVDAAGGEIALGDDATWAGLTGTEVALGDVVLAFDGPIRCITAARPTAFEATAVEPQTHAPAGLERLLDGAPLGLDVLAPGASLTVRYSWRPRTGSAPTS